MQVIKTHTVRISNRLYYIIPNLRNINRMEQQGINNIVQAGTKSENTKYNNIDRRP